MKRFKERLKSIGFGLEKPISTILGIIRIFFKTLKDPALPTFQFVLLCTFSEKSNEQI